MDWILRRAALVGARQLMDVALVGSQIQTIAPHLPGPAAREWDLAGRMLLPGLVDAHTHLDKTYLTTHNQSGTLMEAIQVWRGIKATRSPQAVRDAAARALRTAIANGVTAMRTHVDTEEMADLARLEAILDLRREMAGWIDLQVVALGFPGNSQENDRVMAEALALGADCVGGVPAITPDPRATVDAALDLAERIDRPVDLHIDETEDPQMRTLAYLAEQTIQRGLQGRVTAGHCCSLAFVPDAEAARIMDRVAEADLHIITLPSCNLTLMGRGMQPPPRGITRVKELWQRGISVSAASDNVQDPFNPFGSYNLLQAAHLTAHVAHMTGSEELAACLEMVTTQPAHTLGLTDYGLRPGGAADLVVLDTLDLRDAVTAPPPVLGVFKSGTLVVRTSIEQHWHP